MINCADNTGARNLLPAAGVGDIVMATIKKGKSELRKNIHPVMHIVNRKGRMKGSAVIGPAAKECADLWPGIASSAGSIACFFDVFVKKM
ncbi:hypothetical protein AB1E18_015622 [Capra hircus]